MVTSAVTGMVIRDKLEPSLRVYPKHSPVGYRYLGAARPTAGGIRTSTTAGQLRADNNDDGEDNADYLEPIHGSLQHSADSNAKTVCGDIALVTEQKQLSKALDLYSGSSGLRIYSGYAGWGKGQLEKEIELGGWLLKPFQSSAVYDSKPTTLWDRFLASMETMLARRA